MKEWQKLAKKRKEAQLEQACEVTVATGKAHFTGPLITEKVLYKEKRNLLWVLPIKIVRTKFFWRVKQEFSLVDAKGNVINTVPVGFPTDFSSVPWPLRWLCPKDDVDAQSAVNHDNMYHKYKPHSVVKRNYSQKRYTKEECDYWFLVGMRICGQTKVIALGKWRAVVRFGWYGWNKKDKPIESAE